MTKRLLACWFIIVFFSTTVHAGWIKAQEGQVPANAIVAGKNRNGQLLYVCRVQYEGGVYPGASDSQNCSITYDGKEYSLPNYEILVGVRYSWVTVYNGEIPFDALLAGKELQGELSIYLSRGG